MQEARQTIKADTYSVHVSNNMNTVQDWFTTNAHQYSSIFILVDENTHKYCLPLILESVIALKEATLIEVPAGEAHKDLTSCTHIWKALSKAADRKSLLVNLGGGVVTDMGGFAAGCFKRGIHFVNIPTTLLAMVDASVGAKTGIDFEGLKNEIGLFNNPQAVFVNPIFLNTLPQRQILSGYAEMLKHGLIADKQYWETLSTLNSETITEWTAHIAHSINIKNNVVLQDPTEKGLRKILNFGHTLGHGIESYSLAHQGSAALLHGEAIAVGMLLESYLSNKISGFSATALKNMAAYILKYYPVVSFDENEVINLLQFDKKNEKGKVLFSLLTKEGECVVNQECPVELIKEAFAYYKSKF